MPCVNGKQGLWQVSQSPFFFFYPWLPQATTAFWSTPTSPSSLPHFSGHFLLLIFTHISIWSPRVSLQKTGLTLEGWRGPTLESQIAPGPPGEHGGEKGEEHSRANDCCPFTLKWLVRLLGLQTGHCWESWGSCCWRGRGGKEGVWPCFLEAERWLGWPPAALSHCSLSSSHFSHTRERIWQHLTLGSVSGVSLSSHTTGCRTPAPLGSLTEVFWWRC